MIKIAITGAPCSGKTEFIRWVNNSSSDFIVLPEIASITKSTGLKFKTEIERTQFQKVVFGLQKDFEKQIADVTICEEQIVTLCDRGTVDAVAYCQDSFIRENNIDVIYEAASYDMVIFFKLPENERVYDELCKENIYRDEDYVTSKHLEQRLLSLWGYHKNLVTIPFMKNAVEKYELAHDALLEFLEKHRRLY